MTMSPDIARKVASGFLEATGQALLSGDFDLFRDCFRLPQSIVTVGGTRLLETETDLRQTFEEVRRHYARIGMERLDRWIEVALFDGPDVIRSCHVTHMLSQDGRLLNSPVLTLSRIVRAGDRWWIAGTQYSVPADGPHGQALLSANRDRDQAAQGGGAAEAIFQHHLDRVTRAYVEDRFDLLSEAVQYPLFVQASAGTMVIADQKALEEDFNRLTTQLRIHAVTDIVRRVQSAEIIGDRRIHGAYRTHILSGERLVIPAYKSAMTVEQGDDLNWRMTSVTHPIGHPTLQSQPAPKPGFGQGGYA
ncbi:hypothetical protein [Mameliella sediminis]|uniref:hypothetical protein n=1 Tax=Mameliella sediminis TaxID=2836866 RepID=UPI001C43849A|nr:hypothetical protein [Mameliella sediminis]MBY6116862.1 hypothetical protein [Antarctobacter heliothermus]MBY6146615.1 hypothetical protein [Mameliella alba]MBV7396528.1 hypothetical protein [Mameliella sediminis]MBY6162844.1 hypothetical protein [Mameliella alba]MBY6171108.1 hypothetical protein [Mameliella alba]